MEGLRTLSLLPDPTTVLAVGRMCQGGNNTWQELSTRELGISTPATSPLEWDTNETGTTLPLAGSNGTGVSWPGGLLPSVSVSLPVSLDHFLKQSVTPLFLLGSPACPL